MSHAAPPALASETMPPLPAAIVPCMDTPAATLLGQRLRTARLARGWSQLELAVRCGLHAQIIGRIERGQTPTPRMTTIGALARALDIAPAWLLSDDPGAPGGP